MMNTMQAGQPPFSGWSMQAIQANIAFLQRVTEELRHTGELIETEDLSFPDQARLVQAGTTGEAITCSAFPERKEFLTRFWIVDVDSAERAHAIAARLSAAPGHDGMPQATAVEVRPVMSASAGDFF